MSEHYRKGDIEVIDFIRDQLTFEEYVGFCKGNILKYVPRSNHKGGAEDAKKAQDYNAYWVEALDDLEAQGQLNKDIRDVELLETENSRLKKDIESLIENIGSLEASVRVHASNINQLLEENKALKETIKKQNSDTEPGFDPTAHY